MDPLGEGAIHLAPEQAKGGKFELFGNIHSPRLEKLIHTRQMG
jgi:hypothetical protein